MHCRPLAHFDTSAVSIGSPCECRPCEERSAIMKTVRKLEFALSETRRREKAFQNSLEPPVRHPGHKSSAMKKFKVVQANSNRLKVIQSKKIDPPGEEASRASPFSPQLGRWALLVSAAGHRQERTIACGRLRKPTEACGNQKLLLRPFPVTQRHQ